MLFTLNKMGGAGAITRVNVKKIYILFRGTCPIDGPGLKTVNRIDAVVACCVI